jgi:hypothetical protein
MVRRILAWLPFVSLQGVFVGLHRWSTSSTFVRMSILSLLFVLMFLLLLALGSLSLPQIVVLVSLIYDLLEYVAEIGLILFNHTPMIHATILFLRT